MPACPKCGQQNPELFKFCSECGSALALETPPGREVRKTVTVLFSDVTGLDATRRAARPRVARGGSWLSYFDESCSDRPRAPRRHRREIHRRRRHGGVRRPASCTRTTLCAPSAPPSRCASSSTGLNHELERDVRRERSQVRTGVDTGEVIAGDPSRRAERSSSGDAVNVTARLQGSSRPGGRS